MLQRRRTLSLTRKALEESEEEVKKKVLQRKEWRDYFLSKLDENGMDYEEQDPKVRKVPPPSLPVAKTLSLPSFVYCSFLFISPFLSLLPLSPRLVFHLFPSGL